MKTSLQSILSEEEKIKKQLKLSIEKKMRALESITEKVELLKMELETVKNEYNTRIGKLFLKDNNLDLEIIKYKNIFQLMEKGKTLAQAIKELEDRFYEELLRLQDLQEEIDMAESLLHEGKENTGENPQLPDIRKLWKSLIVKFHPDLVADPLEKARREELMKKINTAYKEKDFEALKILESKTFETKTIESSVSMLEKTLVDIENMIIHLQGELRNLKESDWYNWRIRIEKGKKKNLDIFADLERNLLNDITKKIDILNGLRAKIGTDMPL